MRAKGTARHSNIESMVQLYSMHRASARRDATRAEFARASFFGVGRWCFGGLRWPWALFGAFRRRAFFESVKGERGANKGGQGGERAGGGKGGACIQARAAAAAAACAG